MKMTNKQMTNVYPGLVALSQKREKGEKFKLPVGVGFKLAIARQKMMPLIEAFNDMRDELIDEHCKKDEAGQKMKVPAVLDPDGATITPEQWDMGDGADKFKAEYKELLLQEVELVRVEPLKITEFGKKDSEEMDAEMIEVLSLLYPLVEFE